MKGWWSSLMVSLAGLRRLSQPYFLPLEAGVSSFALLLAARVAVVVGLSFLIADGFQIEVESLPPCCGW
jgi:hypothetical protein